MYQAPRTQVPVTPLTLAYREPTFGEPIKTTKRAVAIPKENKPKKEKWQNPIVINDAYAAHWVQIVKGLSKIDRPTVVKLAAKHAKMCAKLSNATEAQLIDYIENKYSVNELIQGFMALGVATPQVAIKKLPTGKCRLIVTLASGYVLHVVMCKFNFKQDTWILFTEVILTNADQEELCSVLRINCGAPKSLMARLTYSYLDIEDAFKKIKCTETTSNYLGIWLYRIHTLPKEAYWIPLGQSLI